MRSFKKLQLVYAISINIHDNFKTYIDLALQEFEEERQCITEQINRHIYNKKIF